MGLPNKLTNPMSPFRRRPYDYTEIIVRSGGLPLRCDAGLRPKRTLWLNGANAEEAKYPYLDRAFRIYNENYRLGPGDEISVRVKGQPAYSMEKTRVSPDRVDSSRVG